MPQTRTNKKRDAKAETETEASEDTTVEEPEEKPMEKQEESKQDEKTEEPALVEAKGDGDSQAESESVAKRQKTEEDDAAAGENGSDVGENQEVVQGEEGNPKEEQAPSEPVEAKKVEEIESGAAEKVDEVRAAEA